MEFFLRPLLVALSEIGDTRWFSFGRRVPPLPLTFRCPIDRRSADGWSFRPLSRKECNRPTFRLFEWHAPWALLTWTAPFSDGRKGLRRVLPFCPKNCCLLCGPPPHFPLTRKVRSSISLVTTPPRLRAQWILCQWLVSVVQPTSSYQVAFVAKWCAASGSFPRGSSRLLLFHFEIVVCISFF